jgi:hypothetical protein
VGRETAALPVAMFLPAAILAHLSGGGSAIQMAIVMSERASIRSMVAAVREDPTLDPSKAVGELSLELEPAPMPQAESPSLVVAPDGAATDDTVPQEALTPEAKALAAAREAEAVRALPKPPAPAPDKPDEAKPEKRAEAEKKPEPPKKEEPKLPAKETPPPPPLPPEPDRRIAIRQHVDDEHQPDNPTASRIADHANHVKEETMARVRSYDEDAKRPKEGKAPTPSTSPEKGDGSKETKAGHSEEKKGDPNKGPGERDKGDNHHEHHRPGAEIPPEKSGGKPVGTGPKGALTPPDPGRAASQGNEGGVGKPTPNAGLAPNGSYSLDPVNGGGQGGQKGSGQRAPSVAPKAFSSLPLGLGGNGVPGGPNLNLDMSKVVAAVGEKQLAAERLGAGKALRAERKGGNYGQWERWRSAIENYDPTVKLGNQTALNAAAKPFATYLNSIHNRIHPKFADDFLQALNSLPKGHSLNDMHLVAHVELVLSKDEGKIVRMGMAKRSGNSIFDAVALSSIDKASPFGKAPSDIVSSDGNVYLHWEFHRDPVDACSSRNARPYLVKNPPKATPAEPSKLPKAPKKPSLDDRAPPARRPE